MVDTEKEPYLPSFSNDNVYNWGIVFVGVGVATIVIPLISQLANINAESSKQVDTFTKAAWFAGNIGTSGLLAYITWLFMMKLEFKAYQILIFVAFLSLIICNTAFVLSMYQVSF